jgi:hypothetical protein
MKCLTVFLLMCLSFSSIVFAESDFERGFNAGKASCQPSLPNYTECVCKETMNGWCMIELVTFEANGKELTRRELTTSYERVHCYKCNEATKNYNQCN